MTIGNNKPHVTASSVSSTSKLTSIFSAPKGWARFTDKAAAKAAKQAGTILGEKFSPEIHQKMGTDILRLDDTINTLKSDSSSSKISLSQFIATTKSIEKSIQTINDRLIRKTKSAPGKDTYDPMLNCAEKLALIKLKNQLATIKSTSGEQLVTTEKTRLANTIATMPALDLMDSFLKTASQCATDLAELNNSINTLSVPDTTDTIKAALEKKIADRVDYIKRSPDLTPLDVAIVIDQMNAVWTANKAMNAVLVPESSYTDLAGTLKDLANEYPHKIEELLRSENIDKANAMRDGLAEALDLVTGLPQVATAITDAKTALFESETAIAKFNLVRHVTTIENDLRVPSSLLDQIENDPHQLAHTLQHQLQELESLKQKARIPDIRSRSSSLGSTSTLTSSATPTLEDRCDDCFSNLKDLVQYANSLATLKDAENAIPDTKTAKKSQTAASVKESLDHLDRALLSTNPSLATSGSSAGSNGTNSVTNSLSTRQTLTSSKATLETRKEELSTLFQTLSAIEAMDKQVAALSRGSIQDRVKALSHFQNTANTKPNSPSKEYKDALNRLDTATATTIRDAKKAINSALKPPLQSQTTYGRLRGQNALTSAHAKQVKEGVELFEKLQGIQPPIDLSEETAAVATLSAEITNQVEAQIRTIIPTANSALPQLLKLKEYCSQLPESVGATALENVNTQLAGRGAKIQRDINAMIDGYATAIPHASDPKLIDNLSAQVEILKKTLPADKFQQAVEEIQNVMETKVKDAITAAMLTSYTNTAQLQTLGKIFDTVQSMRKALGVAEPTPDTVLDALKVKSDFALDAELGAITNGIDTLDFNALTERQDQIDALSKLVSKDARVALGFADKTSPKTKALNLEMTTKIVQRVVVINDDKTLNIDRLEIKAYIEFLDRMNEKQFEIGKWDAAEPNMGNQSPKTVVTHLKTFLHDLLDPKSDGGISATILDITSLADADPDNAAKQLNGLKINNPVWPRTAKALNVLADKITSPRPSEEKIQLATAMLKLESGVKTTEMETILKTDLIGSEFKNGLLGIVDPHDQIKQLAEYSDAISGMGLPEASRKALQTELWAVANTCPLPTIGTPVSEKDIESAKTLLRLGCDGTLGAYANEVSEARSEDLGTALTNAFASKDIEQIKTAAAAGKELLKADTNGTAGTFTKILEDECIKLLNPNLPASPSIKDLYIVHTALTASPVKLPAIETALLEKLKTLCGTLPATADSLDDLKMLTELSTAYGKHKQPGEPTKKMSELFSTAKATVAAAWATQFNSDVTAAITKYDEISARTFSSDKMQIMSKSGASAVLETWAKFDELTASAPQIKSLTEVAELRPSIGFFKIKASESKKFERIRAASHLASPPSPQQLNRAQIAQIIAVLKENQAPNEDNIPKEQRDKMTAAINTFFTDSSGALNGKFKKWELLINQPQSQSSRIRSYNGVMSKLIEVYTMLKDAELFMKPNNFASAEITLGQAVQGNHDNFHSQTGNAIAIPRPLIPALNKAKTAMVANVLKKIDALKTGTPIDLTKLNKLLDETDNSIRLQLASNFKEIVELFITQNTATEGEIQNITTHDLESKKNTLSLLSTTGFGFLGQLQIQAEENLDTAIALNLIHNKNWQQLNQMFLRISRNPTHFGGPDLSLILGKTEQVLYQKATDNNTSSTGSATETLSKVIAQKVVSTDPVTLDALKVMTQLLDHATGTDISDELTYAIFNQKVEAFILNGVVDIAALTGAQAKTSLEKLKEFLDEMGNLPPSTQGVITTLATDLCDQITIPFADDVFDALGGIVAKLGPAVLLPLATKATAAPLSAETLNVMARLLSLSDNPIIARDGTDVLSYNIFKTKLDEFIPINLGLVTGEEDFLSRERANIDAIGNGFTRGSSLDGIIQAKEQSISIAAKLHQLYKLYMLETTGTAAPDYLIHTTIRPSDYAEIQLEASNTTTIGDLFTQVGIQTDDLPEEFLGKRYKDLDDDLLNPLKNRSSMAGGPPAGLGTIFIPNSAGKTNIAALDLTFNATLNAAEHSFERKITNGDGSCGLHGLFAKSTNVHGQLTLENVMDKRAELITTFNGMPADYWKQPEIMEILQNIAMERGMADTRNPATVKAFVQGIFETQLQLTGEDTDENRDGQIHLSELKLIAKMYDLNVWVLAGTPGIVSSFEVWHSKPGDATPAFAVVHSGGAHWERWQIGDPIVGVGYNPDGDDRRHTYSA